MNRIGNFPGQLLANFYGRVNGLSTNIGVKVEKPVQSMAVNELVDDIYERVLSFLKANRFSGNLILRRINNTFTPMSSYVKGLREKLTSIDSGGDSTISNFEASLLKIDNEYRLFMVLSREGSSSSDTVCLYNIKFPVNEKVIKEAIKDLLLNGSYELLGRAKLRKALKEENRKLDLLSSQNYLCN